MLKNRFGFTLSEVLITLVVIGIVAAIAVPSLMNYTNNQQYKSALKKNFSVLSQAFRLASTLDNDDFLDWEYVCSGTFATEVYNKLSKYWYIQKDCGLTNRNDCWADKTYAFSRRRYSNWFINEGKWSGGGDAYGFVLNDGTFVFLNIFSESAMNDMGISENIIAKASVGFLVDVNGAKGPNTVGKDIHAFGLTTKGLVPAGIDDNSQNCNIKNIAHNCNWDCTAKMFK